MSNKPTRPDGRIGGTKDITYGAEKPNVVPYSTTTHTPANQTGKGTKHPHPNKPNHLPPRISKHRRPRSLKPNLRIFTRDIKFALPLAPSKRERLAPGPPADEATTAALAQCVDLALRLLEEGRGNRVLVGIGVQIVAERRAEAAWAGGGGRPEAGIYKGDLKDMPMWVAKFLWQVREFGIPICVCDSLSGYGLTQRWAWGSNMDDYDSRTSAVVYIHQCLIDGLLRSKRSIEHCVKKQQELKEEVQEGAREMDSITTAEFQHLQHAQAIAQKSLERAVFSISVFLAHEFVHCFTGFLTGSSQPGTPPALNASPYSDAKYGEAGWYWTRHTFGGLGHVWLGKAEPAGPGHFGVPMLLEFNKRRGDSFFYRIDHAVVKRVIGGDWDSANRVGMYSVVKSLWSLPSANMRITDPNWFLKLKDKNTGIPFKEWDTAYEEIVARTTSKHNVIQTKSGIRVLFELVCVVLRPCLSWASRVSLRDILSLSSIRSRMRNSSRPSLRTLNAISKVKRWCQT